MIEPAVSRRSFLGGLLVLSAAAAVPASALSGSPARIYGDGIHDDTEGLNALFRGEPVHFVNDNATVQSVGNAIYFSGGTFLVSDIVRLDRSAHIDNITFITAPGFHKTVLHVAKGDEIANIYIGSLEVASLERREAAEMQGATFRLAA